MIGYVRYLVTSQLFKRVVIHYLVTGHTNFSPDRMFGWTTMVLRFCDLFSAMDIVKSINLEKSKSYSAILCKESMFKDWIAYINNNYTTIKGVKSWHLVEVSIEEKNKTISVQTRAKKVHKMKKLI